MTSGWYGGHERKSLSPVNSAWHWSLRATHFFCRGPAPPSMVSASKPTYRSLDNRSSLGKCWVLDALTNLKASQSMCEL